MTVATMVDPVMADNRAPSSEQGHPVNWQASDQSLLLTTVMATPAQRLAWLEEALRLAYATGALKPRRMMTQEEWDAMGSLPQ